MKRKLNSHVETDSKQGLALSNIPLHTLSSDTLSHLLSFLSIGSTLMLAMTSKSNHNLISNLLQKNFQIVRKQPWSLTKALRTRERFYCITFNNLEILSDALRNRTLSSLTKHLYIQQEKSWSSKKQKYPKSEDFLKVISEIPKEGVDEEIKVISYSGKKKKDIIVSQFLKMPPKLGWDFLGEVTLSRLKISPLETLLYISHLKNICALSLLDLDADYKNKGITEVKLPILEHLKRLNVHSFGYDEGSSYFFALLEAAPNLEKLRYIFQEAPGDVILEKLMKFNPKLKDFHLESDCGATPCGSEITDSGLIQFLQRISLERIHLVHSEGISGSFFQQMGDACSQLQEFFLDRSGYESGIIDEYKNPCFGGSPMKNCQKLMLVGDWKNLTTQFSESLQKLFPNLQELELETEAESVTKILIDILENCVHLKSFSLTTQKKVNIHSILKSATQNPNLTHLEILCSESKEKDPFSWKDVQWPSIKSLNIPMIFSKESLTDMESACPNLETIIIYNQKKKESDNDIRKKVANEFLSDRSKWKNLREFNFSDYSLQETRPEILPSYKPYRSRYRRFSGDDFSNDYEVQYKFSNKRKKEGKIFSYNDFVSLWLKNDFGPIVSDDDEKEVSPVVSEEE